MVEKVVELGHQGADLCGCSTGIQGTQGVVAHALQAASDVFDG